MWKGEKVKGITEKIGEEKDEFIRERRGKR